MKAMKAEKAAAPPQEPDPAPAGSKRSMKVMKVMKAPTRSKAAKLLDAAGEIDAFIAKSRAPQESESTPEPSSEEDPEPVVKRPAAAGVRKTPAAADGAAGSRKDRNKDNAWTQMSKRGDIPTEIVEAFAKASKKEQREAVNDAVVRQQDGSWGLNLGSRSLGVIIQKERRQTAGTKNEGLIEQVARTMCGGAAGLAEAIAAGNVVKGVDSEGRTRFWIGKEVADDLTHLSGSSTLRGEMKLTPGQWRSSKPPNASTRPLMFYVM